MHSTESCFQPRWWAQADVNSQRDRNTIKKLECRAHGTNFHAQNRATQNIRNREAQCVHMAALSQSKGFRFIGSWRCLFGHRVATGRKGSEKGGGTGLKRKDWWGWSILPHPGAKNGGCPPNTKWHSAKKKLLTAEGAEKKFRPKRHAFGNQRNSVVWGVRSPPPTRMEDVRRCLPHPPAIAGSLFGPGTNRVHRGGSITAPRWRSPRR